MCDDKCNGKPYKTYNRAEEGGMKHIYLKFTHGVEIGARLAYLGHYNRTKDENILKIANDELEHQGKIKALLSLHNATTTKFFDVPFFIIGSVINYLCKYSPKFLLNIVAQSLEIFAIFSYDYLATLYPEYYCAIKLMANTENEHKEYFKSLRG